MTGVPLERNAATAWNGFQYWICGCLVALFIATHKLWLGRTSFPAVPTFQCFADGSLSPVFLRALESLGVLLIASGLFHGLTHGRRWLNWPRIWWLVPCGWILLGLLNQHRWQPWAYHASLMCVLFASCRPVEGLCWARRLVVSIYLYSALGKLDAQFLHTVGPQLVDLGFSWFGIDTTKWSETARTGWSAVLPIGELAVAVCLAIPALQRWGWMGATIMHCVLIVILGPWGLAHEWGVVIWNLCFIGQAGGCLEQRETIQQTYQRCHPREANESP